MTLDQDQNALNQQASTFDFGDGTEKNEDAAKPNNGPLTFDFDEHEQQNSNLPPETIAQVDNQPTTFDFDLAQPSARTANLIEVINQPQGEFDFDQHESQPAVQQEPKQAPSNNTDILGLDAVQQKSVDDMLTTEKRKEE